MGWSGRWGLRKWRKCRKFAISQCKIIMSGGGVCGDGQGRLFVIEGQAQHPTAHKTIAATSIVAPAEFLDILAGGYK